MRPAVEGGDNLLGHFVGERDHPLQFKRICHSSLLRNLVGGGHSAETARLLAWNKMLAQGPSAIEMIRPAGRHAPSRRQ